MKQFYLLLSFILVLNSQQATAQNDSIYFWKGGILDIKKSLKTADLDSITFKRPAATTGTQIWTTKNLNVSTYSDGTPIPQVTDPNAWANLTTGAWCYYNNDVANNATYGKLYNWYAVAGIFDAASLATPSLRKQLAPSSWHVATYAEWTALTKYLGGETVAGGKMKETGTTHWISPNTGATNTIGFTALAGGRRNNNGDFSGVGSFGTWWRPDQGGLPKDSWYYYLNYNSGSLSSSHNYWTNGLSVRCLRYYTPLKPTAIAQNFCSGVKVESLVATGTNLRWYATAIGGTAIAITDALVSGTYYVSQTLNNLESDRTSVAVTITPSTTTGSYTGSICGTFYTWPANGQTYTEAQSGVTIVSGCNTATLNLTIAPLTTKGSYTGSIGPGESYTWPVSGITYSTEQRGVVVVSRCNTATLDLLVSSPEDPIVLPSLNTTMTSGSVAISNSKNGIATSGGEITSDGGATVTARGIVWSTSTEPTIALATKTSDGSGIGSFSSLMAGLASGTTYYVRAYATNNRGTAYGAEVSITAFMTYTIGLWPELGGYVFSLDNDGRHGLVSETINQSSGSSWYNAPNIISNPATHSLDGKIFTNWRLPTIDELNQMYNVRDTIGNFSGSFYWSSTLNNRYDWYAWNIDFRDGTRRYGAKDSNSFALRAVRNF